VSVEGCVADLADRQTLLEACDAVDAIVNLAAMNEAACAGDPDAAHRANADGALAWASVAASVGVRRFVQLSTAKVYGVALDGVVTEETPCRPLSPYAITHRLAEQHVARHHPNAVILRLANAFGPPIAPTVACWSIVVNDFCRQAAVDRRVVVRSSGLSWRNIVPMTDVVRALEYAAAGLPSGTYNLGSHRALPLRDIADLVARTCIDTLGFRPPIVCEPAAKEECHVPLDYRIDRLVAAGFAPQAAFENEICDTLKMAQSAV
jgi:UDP-glucose 4-epimerase